MTVLGSHRPAWVEVDLEAVRHNASLLARIVAPAKLSAVVKANGYGHGAVQVATAALEGGASELAVALVDEGIELREAGIAAPILVLSEPTAEAMGEAVARELVPALYTRDGIEAARSAVRDLGVRRAPVEVKVDTGMHRVGAAPDDVVDLVERVLAAPELELGGLWTHFAVADVLDDPFTAEQLDRFDSVRRALEGAGLEVPRVHAANSAGALAWPTSRYDLVRCGIALYGYAPSSGVRERLEAELRRLGEPARLRPVMSWHARVSMARGYAAGERFSYGRVAPLARPCVVATVPLGYADGVERSYFAAGGEVLIAGARCPLAGTVTMDQLLVECSAAGEVQAGEEVVLLGRQGGEEVTAEEWAARLGTVSYEIVTRVGARVPRVFTGAETGAEAGAQAGAPPKRRGALR